MDPSFVRGGSWTAHHRTTINNLHGSSAGVSETRSGRARGVGEGCRLNQSGGDCERDPEEGRVGESKGRVSD